MAEADDTDMLRGLDFLLLAAHRRPQDIRPYGAVQTFNRRQVAVLPVERLALVFKERNDVCHRASFTRGAVLCD